jgi:hypothetical protein
VSKSKKKNRDICLACGGKVKRKQPACKRCGHRNPLFAPKVAASPAFLAKSAGSNVVPIAAAKSARPVCWNGHTGKRSHKCCTACGEPFGISRLEREERVMKAARVIPTGYWAGQAARQADPAQAEIMRELALKNVGGPPDAEAIARAWGYRSLRDAAMFCTESTARDYFMNAFFGSNGGVA